MICKLFMKLKNILLAISLLGFAIAFSNFGEASVWADALALGLPIGTILLGLFLIFTVLEKESALYDEQERQRKIKLGLRASAPKQIRRSPLVWFKKAPQPIWRIQKNSH